MQELGRPGPQLRHQDGLMTRRRWIGLIVALVIVLFVVGMFLSGAWGGSTTVGA